MPRKKKEEVVVEEVQQEQAAPEIRCAVTVGITTGGDVFFDIDGQDQNLVTVDGLLKYAQRHMDNVWSDVKTKETK